MEILMVNEDGTAFQVVNRELNEEERGLVDEGSYTAYRYRGNRFEQALAIEDNTPAWEGVEEAK